MFALAILLGLISGVYSSIFISSVLWLSIRTWETSPGTFKTGSESSLATPRFLAPLGMIAVVGVGGWVAIPSLKPAAVAQVVHADQVRSRPLGDLSPFVKIASDSLALV